MAIDCSAVTYPIIKPDNTAKLLKTNHRPQVTPGWVGLQSAPVNGICPTNSIQTNEDRSMRKALLWATVASGIVAAYLMYRRGERPATIVRESVQHPVRSLIDETQRATA